MQLSKIDDRLTVYKNHTVVIFGVGGAGKRIYEMLSSFGIKAAFFCDNNPELWGRFLYGISIISPKELKEKYSDDYLVQIGSTYENEIEKQLLGMEINRYIYYSEAKLRLINLKRYRFIKENPKLYDFYIDHFLTLGVRQCDSEIWNGIVHPCFDYSKACYFFILPPKTGDRTLMDTTEKYGIYTINLWHSAFNLTDQLRKVIGNKPIKFVAATRDPISQNLSGLYQMMDAYCWDNDSYWINGGDLDLLFKSWVDDMAGVIEDTPSAFISGHCAAKKLDQGKKNSMIAKYYKRMHSIWYIQRFFETVFKENMNIDVYQYPFNKEAGYGIIKTEGVEIFIYQLEKLNEIYSQLFEFLGIENGNAQLVSTNLAEDKWYANAYKKAIKNIHFTRDYFNTCYDTPYVKHFYSDSDIAKFKAKWESHII